MTDLTWFGIEHLGEFLLGTIGIVLLPGPNSLFVLSVAARQGIRRGYAGAAGVFVGDTVLILVSVLGAASLLRVYPNLFLGIKIIGALYLAWIGLQLLLQAYSILVELVQKNPSHLPTPTPTPTTPPHPTLSDEDTHHPFHKALIISLLNPKAMLFFVSYFVQFVNPKHPNSGIGFFILGVLAQIISLTYLTILIVSGAKLAQSFAKHRLWAAIGQGVIGLLFFTFCFKLATSNLH